VHESKPAHCTLAALDTTFSVTTATVTATVVVAGVGSSVFVHRDDLRSLSNVQCVHYWCVPVVSDQKHQCMQ
jgi:hypothetical protein